MQSLRMIGIAAAALALAGGACRSSAPTAGSDQMVAAADDGQTTFRVETVVRGVEVPWSIVWTPDGRMLFTERPGRVRVVDKNGVLRAAPLATLPEVRQVSESGLMGMTLHPEFTKNRLLYLAYAYSGGAFGQSVRVVRYRETGEALVERKVLIENIPAAPNHAGTRLRFGPDRKLYVTTGDATDRNLAQQLDSLAGKTLRLGDDGTVPADNPFVGRSGGAGRQPFPAARPEIWSYGHRNAQGLDWQPGTGLQFQTEHGPSGFDGPGGGDEVNVVARGKNYGWPLVSHRERRAGTEPPLLLYTPAVAPASGTFYRGRALPGFRNNFFFGGLRGRCIVRVVLDGSRVVRQERLLDGRYGRIREVAEGPDGALYFSTSNQDGRGSPARDDDRILRIVPVTKTARR